MRLYYEIAARAFRRSSDYRGAALAGLFTNAVFGAVLKFMYKAVYGAGGSMAEALRSRFGRQRTLVVPAYSHLRSPMGPARCRRSLALVEGTLGGWDQANGIPAIMRLGAPASRRPHGPRATRHAYA